MSSASPHMTAVQQRRADTIDMKLAVSKFEKRKKYQVIWNDAINDGLIDNVADIVEHVYQNLIKDNRYFDQYFENKYFKKQMGQYSIGEYYLKNNNNWERKDKQRGIFVLKVIKYLKQNDYFSYGKEEKFDGEINLYDDPGSGCDIATEEAIEFLLKKSLK